MAQRPYSVNLGAPPRPNRKPYPFKGTIKHKGLTIHVENLPGDKRKGKWPVYFPYGEIHKTEGLDGDKVDVFVGPDAESDRVYIVNQKKPDGSLDEQKVMLGFSDRDAAESAYRMHYSNDGKDFFMGIQELTMPDFKKKVFGDQYGEKIAEAYRSGYRRALLDKIAADADLAQLTPEQKRGLFQAMWDTPDVEYTEKELLEKTNRGERGGYIGAGVGGLGIGALSALAARKGFRLPAGLVGGALGALGGGIIGQSVGYGHVPQTMRQKMVDTQRDADSARKWSIYNALLR